MDQWMYLPNLKSVALPFPEIVGVKFLGRGCKPPILGRGRLYGLGMVPFERALVNSYRLPIVTFPLSLRVSEILPLLAPARYFSQPTSIVSQKFPHVPLGAGRWPLDTRSEGDRLCVRAISFQGFQPMWSQSTNVTDRQTDRWHAIPVLRFALKCIAR